MQISIGNDRLLIHASKSLETVLTQFTLDCGIVSNTEFYQDAEPQKYESNSRACKAIAQWRLIVQQIARLASSTNIGIVAKGRAVRCCVEHDTSIEKDLKMLIESLTVDIDRLLSSDPDNLGA